MRTLHRWLFGLTAIVFLAQTYFAFTADDPIGPMLGAVSMALLMIGSGWQMRQ
ncbi:MAG: hypothetical protein ABGZ36_23310 [Actinomycetota bacterium]